MKGKIVKSLIALCLVATMVMSSFAAVVSDDDSSAFVTKAEFEAIKSNYDNQIKGYLSSVDEKIDNTIANYLNNFAGGAGGKLEMSEKTAVYRHTITFTKYNDITLNGATFILYSTRKTPWTVADWQGEKYKDGNYRCSIRTIPNVLKEGIGWPESESLSYAGSALFRNGNGYQTAIRNMDQIVNATASATIDGKEVKYIRFASYLDAACETTADPGFYAAYFYIEFQDSSGTRIIGAGNIGHRFEFTDNVTTENINPVEFGTKNAVSGQMIATGGTALGLPTAIYQHTVSVTKIATQPVNLSFVIFSTYDKVAPVEWFQREDTKTGIIENLELAKYGIGYNKKPLLYIDDLHNMRAKVGDTGYNPNGYLYWTADFTIEGKTYKHLRLEDWVDPAVNDGKPYYRWRFIPNGGTATEDKIFNGFSDVTFGKSRVNLYAINPVGWHARKFVTSEMLGYGTKVITGSTERPFELRKSGAPTEGINVSTLTRLVVYDNGQSIVPVRLTLVYTYTANQTASTAATCIGSLYYNGVKLGMQYSTYAASYGRSGKADIAWNGAATSGDEIYVVIKSDIIASNSLYATFSGELSRADLVAAKILPS